MGHFKGDDRILAIDWLRGLSVLLMIRAHSMILLKPELHHTRLYHWLDWIDGSVSPAFLLAAGFSLALVQCRAAPKGSRSVRAIKTLGRLTEVLAAATLVNWMWFPLLAQPKWIFRMDILHCVGLSLLVALPVVAGLARRPKMLAAVSLVLWAALFTVAPACENVRGVWSLALNNSSNALFPLMPWMSYVFLGSFFGALASFASFRQVVIAFAVAGNLAALGGTFNVHWGAGTHLRRIAVVCAATCFFLLLERGLRRAKRERSLSVLQAFGTASLSAYVFHEGLLHYPIARFSFETLWAAQKGFSAYAGLSVLLIAMTFGLIKLLKFVQSFIRRDAWPYLSRRFQSLNSWE